MMIKRHRPGRASCRLSVLAVAWLLAAVAPPLVAAEASELRTVRDVIWVWGKISCHPAKNETIFADCDHNDVAPSISQNEQRTILFAKFDQDLCVGYSTTYSERHRESGKNSEDSMQHGFSPYLNNPSG